MRGDTRDAPSVRIERQPAGDFILVAEVVVGRSVQSTFDFLAANENLPAVTPPWLALRVTTPRPTEMRVGTRLGYRLRIRGVPVRWESEVTVWDPPSRFTYEQRHGPFISWSHAHTFVARSRATLIRDEVRYRVPGGVMLHRLFVRRDLERLFGYRRVRLLALLASGS